MRPLGPKLVEALLAADSKKLARVLNGGLDIQTPRAAAEKERLNKEEIREVLKMTNIPANIGQK